jgi:retron-type reverse transcriptase
VSSIDDADVTHRLKVMLRASGKKGVSHGGVISPLLSNLYLSEVDKMLERRARSREMASTPTSNMRGSLTIW